VNLNTPQNQRIQDYNQIIQKSDSDPLNGYSIGPDFFNIFLNRPDLMADELHPNGEGYAVMASSWQTILNP
jgi:lysophospholipase L1-like esterase